MLKRLNKTLGTLCLLAAGAVASPSLAQVNYAQDVAVAPDVAADAQQSEAARIISRGRSFESQQRWGDALSLYEESVRKFPQDAQLQRRFEIARLHFSIERRYSDSSYVGSIRKLTNNEAVQLYNELLRRIDSHYVTSPDWARLASRGAGSLQLALSKTEVRRTNGIRASTQQISALQREIRDTLKSRNAIRTRQDLLAVQQEVARLAAHRVGFSPVATALEFTAAAAGSLDNYSAFLTPDQLRDVYSQIEGNFVGLGVELKADKGALLIVRVIPGSPAEQAGIVDGDRIVGIDGQSIAQLSTDDAASMLTGEEGTFVRVTLDNAQSHLVARPVDGKIDAQMATATPVREITVRRAHVDVPSIEEARIVDAEYGVAYARIPVFQKTTSRDLDAALWDLHRKGMRSLILDLRQNPGGLLTSSVELADKFVAQGNIVSTRGRSEGEDFDYRAHRAGTWRVPLVVLIDGDSASASEIFAAAIRDNRRGTIVGDRSFGKGSVQGIFPLGYGGAGIRLTTAKFYSPTGQPISKVGVSPDIVVRHAKSVADGRQVTAYRGKENDLALDRAIEAARQQMAMRQ